jgi:selenocysteine-specific elongation factor
MGTAGHIDHGKTALVKAMTGIECDTHPQEKQRGITINLGFAHCALPSGNTISIVDVPGHKDFIHTMVSGASGIDFVLLVISADSGVMPQTREHCQIMTMLRITRGVIALTKTDCVDAETLVRVTREIREFTRGSFLEDAPIVPVSSLTREGVPALIAALDACAQRVAPRRQEGIFRLFIDRIFSVSGFGTVVTGSVISGVLRVGGQAFLAPGGEKLRVRRLERHNVEVDAVVAGDRASLNCAGLDRKDFKRGMCITDRNIGGTQMLDAQVTLVSGTTPGSHWLEAIFLLGTFEAQARLHLLDRNSAPGKDTVLVQVRLPQPCVACAGDRFVLRSTSGDVTLGGGEIIDAAPLHHRRRRPALIRSLETIAEGKLPALIESEVRKARHVIHHATVADHLSMTEEEIKKGITGAALTEDIIVQALGDAVYLVEKDVYRTYQEKLIAQCRRHHEKNPLDANGITIKEAVSLLGIDRVPGSDGYVRLVLEALVTQKKLHKAGSTYVSGNHGVLFSAELQHKIDITDTFFGTYGRKVPLAADIDSFATKKGITPKELQQILGYLVEHKRIHRSDGDYLHEDIVGPIRTLLLHTLVKEPHGLTVAQFRDLITGNRKICLVLFALFDSEKITERRGDVRVITEKGKMVLAG